MTADARATKRTHKVVPIARVVGVSIRWGSIESECLSSKDRSNALPLPSRVLRPCFFFFFLFFYYFFFFFVVYLCNCTKLWQSRGSLSILCRMCRGNQRWRHVRAFITMGSSCRPDRWKPYVTNGWGEQDFRPVIPLMPAETGFYPGKWVIQELQDEIHTMLQFARLGKFLMRRGSTEGIRHSVAVFKRQEQCPSPFQPFAALLLLLPPLLCLSPEIARNSEDPGGSSHIGQDRLRTSKKGTACLILAEALISVVPCRDTMWEIRYDGLPTADRRNDPFANACVGQCRTMTVQTPVFW